MLLWMERGGMSRGQGEGRENRKWWRATDGSCDVAAGTLSGTVANSDQAVTRCYLHIRNLSLMLVRQMNARSVFGAAVYTTPGSALSLANSPLFSLKWLSEATSTFTKVLAQINCHFPLPTQFN